MMIRHTAIIRIYAFEVHDSPAARMTRGGAPCRSSTVIKTRLHYALLADYATQHYASAMVKISLPGTGRSLKRHSRLRRLL